ncbi:MAG: dihydropteroate synthase [Spirochaetia bacterium]
MPDTDPLLTLRDRLFTGKSAPYIMGILNITPDSFYAGSRARSAAVVAETAERMEADGADILDIGGESTRPGSDYVSPQEELDRVLPAVEAIRRRSSIPLSVDTRKSLVAEAALNAGADMINDVSALRDDPELARLCAERNVPVVLMHMRETPKTMQVDPHYRDVISEIIQELEERIEAARAAGVRKEQIIIDPGIGFGKRYEDNLRILHGLQRLREPGFPLLMGLSRKSFLGRAAAGPDREPLPAEKRLISSVAANLWSVLEGADMVRVHDVEATAQALRVIEAIRKAGGENGGVQR